ncbi:MAG: hypothetical protein PHT46_01675 [Candidatus Marinimicrobia bacterium]|jgi:hypothetical protein|nr:hypothetical protein [Candidatus Neomarinimicrobiota bacterium]MDX9778109.1 hypothetical protein [bacterium]
MINKISTLLQNFVKGGEDPFILWVLLGLLVFFTFSTVILFFIAFYIRSHNLLIEKRREKQHKSWDPYILGVMDGSLTPEKAFQDIRANCSIPYLMYLEKYISVLRGKEKERLQTLGTLSMRRIKKLLNSPFRNMRLFGIHLLALFNQEEAYKSIRIARRDKDLILLAIIEMRMARDPAIKKRLLQYLFGLPFVSPIYISNIAADMGTGITPYLREMILKEDQKPFILIVAAETLKHMHDASCLDLTAYVLGKGGQMPAVLAAWLRYMEMFADETYLPFIKPFTAHAELMVRIAAIRAYIEATPRLSVFFIEHCFNDPSVQIAVNAAEKLHLRTELPYIEIDRIAAFRWGEIYREMVY